MSRFATIWRAARVGAAGAVLVLGCGCAAWYFRDAGAPPIPPPQYRLAAWPYQEYWTGIVFNGAKIGFAHLSMAATDADPDVFVVGSEAAFLLRLLGFTKQVRIQTTDQVHADLTLRAFRHRYRLDGTELVLEGEHHGDALSVQIDTGGRVTAQTLPAPEKVYPVSVIPLYPVLHGLEVGRRYAYQVYDGQTQSLASVTQTVDAYERSDLFRGAAFKVTTTLHGHRTTAWIDARGRPLLELALNGVLIAALENEATAKRYLALASINKQEVMLDFSLVRTDRALPAPRALRSLKVALTGLNGFRPPPADQWQACVPEGEAMVCDIRSASAPRSPAAAVPGAGDLDGYLRATVAVPSSDARIVRLAHEIVGETPHPRERIERLLGWITANIRKQPVDVFSAIDVLEGRQAECQGHAYLYAAFARALGIPTRVVNGLVYSEDVQGFLYHSWTESYVGDAWLPVDPTFAQLPADATHIKLIEGENPTDLLPLIESVGRVRARILAFGPS